MNRDFSDIRNDFIKESLNENQLSENPIEQVKAWLNNAVVKKEPEATAMNLCTVSPEGIPSARVVLLKNIDENGGLWFFTNYNSKKGEELEKNNNAAVNFFWPTLERQIRAVGTVDKISSEESDKYFQSRPIESQLSAIVSPQSQVIESRELLEKWFDQAREIEIKRPENWGGYALQPVEIEFWQGRAGRLHDRIRYRFDKNKWVRERLAP